MSNGAGGRRGGRGASVIQRYLMPFPRPRGAGGWSRHPGKHGGEARLTSVSVTCAPGREDSGALRPQRVPPPRPRPFLPLPLPAGSPSAAPLAGAFLVTLLHLLSWGSGSGRGGGSELWTVHSNALLAGCVTLGKPCPALFHFLICLIKIELDSEGAAGQ